LDATLDLLTLALLPGTQARTARDLAARGPIAAALAEPEAHRDVLGEAACAALKSGAARRAAEAEAQAAGRAGARVIGWHDPEYPQLLRRIYDPPPVLYVRGRLDPDDGERAVALVGARAATPGGRVLAAALARDLGAWGATVVSGLARGIDTAAHEGALEGGGRTVAVLGSGIDRLYPPENERLARAIAERGAVVSEFPLGTRPLPQHFPRRNRVIAGWSRAVVVVEAAARSGALNTARTALDEGRDVMAVPGHPSQPSHAGTNQLLREGAALVRDARDVAEEIGLDAPEAKPTATAGDPLLDALRADAPAGLEDLQRRTGLETAELLARLSRLELSERVRRLPGARFVRHH
jgi:DNA processing protein